MIGCGAISMQDLETAARLDATAITAVEARYGPRATGADVLVDPGMDLLLNLPLPAAQPSG